MMMCIHENVNGFVLVVIPNNGGSYNHRARKKSRTQGANGGSEKFSKAFQTDLHE